MDDKQKLEEAKKLLEEYGELVKNKKYEYDKMKQELDSTLSALNKLPPFIKKRYIKDETVKKMLEEYVNQGHGEDIRK